MDARFLPRLIEDESESVKNRGQKLHCIDCKYKSRPFQKLTDEQLSKVNDHRVDLGFRKGELLVKQGMLSPSIVFIRKGFAKLFIEKDGEMVVLGIARPGEFVGIQSLYGKPISLFSVAAITDMEVCLKDIRVFKDLILENPEFASGIIETLSTDLAQSYKRMFSLNTQQVNGRLAELLVFLCNVLYQSNPFDLTISKKEIAGLISTSPENLSRLLGEFKAKGIIESTGQCIEVLDMDELESLCNCDSMTVKRI